jgi:hypothetical protein
MTLEMASPSSTPDRGARVALLYALVAERLSAYYEHGQWLTEAQGASLCADWLSRSKLSLPIADRKHLSALSDQFARQIAASLSREVGLFTAHEMMESLDPNYESDVGRSLMVECQRFLDTAVATEASTKRS